MAEFAVGGAPLWQHYSIADVFADAFLDAEQRLKERSGKPFFLLAGSLQLVNESFMRLLRDRNIAENQETLKFLQEIQKAMAESIQLGARLPIGKLDDEDAAVRKQKTATKFLEFLSILQNKVSNMRAGDLLWLPGGWRTTEDGDGGALLYALYRRQDEFTFCVSNTNSSGFDYHPAMSEVNPPKLKRAMSITFEHVPLQRLMDSSFWFMLFRPMVFPHETNGAKYLYETLFPYLNQRPVSANAVRQPESVLREQDEWKTPAGAKPPAAQAAVVFNPKTAEPLSYPPLSSGNPFDMGQSMDLASSMPAATNNAPVPLMFHPVPPAASAKPGAAAASPASAALGKPAAVAATTTASSSSLGGLKIPTMKAAATPPPVSAASTTPKPATAVPIAPIFSGLAPPAPPLAPVPPKPVAMENDMDWGDFSVSPAPPAAKDDDPFASLSIQKQGPSGLAGPMGDFGSDYVCDFRTPPRGGDASFARLVLQQVHTSVRMMDGSKEQSKCVSMLVRYSLLRMMQSDLLVCTKNDLKVTDRQLVERAIKNLSHAAHKEAKEGSSSTTTQLFEIKRLVNDVKVRLEVLSIPEKLPPELELGELPAQSSDHAFFGRMRADLPDVEPLAGSAPKPPIYRPVQLTLIPDRVSTIHDVSVALRHCAALCTRLAHQQSLIKNTYLIRVALIQHLFTRVIPIPLPLDSPEKSKRGFWGSQKITRETQVDLMRSLALVSQHFACAALSVTVTRSLDAVRILTMACIAAVADALMRMNASDVPSPVAAIYAGNQEVYGEQVFPFGIEMRQFAAESAFFTLTDPNLQLVRTCVLDYFIRMRKSLKEDHVLFKWEQSMDCSNAEEMFVDNICLAVGYPRPAEQYAMRNGDLALAAKMWTGEAPEMLTDFPELGHFRDVVMVLKILMAPTADSLPKTKAWMPSEAILEWRAVKLEEQKKFPLSSTQGVADWLSKIKPSTSAFQVFGFAKTELKPTWGGIDPSEDANATWYSRLFSKMKQMFLSPQKEPRVSPSLANPSFLLGTAVSSEEDVLHVKKLPDFGLSPRNVELLASYLTVPYLRIPLVLRFFSSQEMTTSLRHRELQDLVDGVVFEGGEWHSGGEIPTPLVVPCPDREFLATPLGLLFNELRFAPDAIIDSLEKMLVNMLEIDTGRYSKHTSGASLYVIRLIMRIMGYMQTLLSHARWARAPPGLITTGGGGTHIRGLECPPPLEAKLDATTAKWRSVILARVFPMIAGWIKHCSEGDLELACILRAHLAYLFKETDWVEAESPSGNNAAGALSQAHLAAKTLLTSQLFITASYRVATEPRLPSRFQNANYQDHSQAADIQRAQTRLGLDELELFSLFQRHRFGLLNWFKSNTSTTNEIMEYAVSVLVNDAERKMAQRHHNGSGNSATAAYEARLWIPMVGMECEGRFVPDTEYAENQKRVMAVPRDFEEYLRQGGNRMVDTELNIQLGEFTLKNHRVEPLDPVVCEFNDFADVFGERIAQSGGVHCAEVVNKQRRMWVRLVGQRHDIQLWQADDRAYAAVADPNPNLFRPYPAKLLAHERWIYEALEPMLRLCDPNRIELFCLEPTAMDSEIARLAARVKTPTQTEGIFIFSMKEIVVVRGADGRGGDLLIYEIGEIGRKYYGTLVYTSNPAIALHNCVSGNEVVAFQLLSRPVMPNASIVISRNLMSSVGVQVFLPDRFMYGLIPEALIEEYCFWQNKTGGDIIGHMRSAVSKSGASKPLFQLRIQVAATEGSSPQTLETQGGFNFSSGKAVVTRYALSASKPTNPETPLLGVGSGDVINASAPVYILLNLATNNKQPAVKRICELLLRLDCMSHICAWARTTPGSDKQTLELIEFPRLGLTFRMEMHQGKRVMACVDHPGLFVSNEARSCRRTQALLKGVPHGIVLERDSDGALFLLLPSTAKPTSVRHKGPGKFDAHELVLVRQDSSWLANLQDEKSTNAMHYLYPIHASRSFLFTQTFASALYLMLLRMITNRYDEAFRLADFCVTDTKLSPEEKQLVDAVVASQQNALQIPDAIAVRLKILIITAGTPVANELPWNAGEELNRYLASLPHISGACRLSREEELLLLELSSSTDDEETTKLKVSAAAINRLTFLLKLENQFKTSPNEPFIIPVTHDFVDKQNIYNFDGVDDTSALGVDDVYVSKMALMTYTKPEDAKMQGATAILSLEQWIRPGRLKLRGGSDSLGFLFLYELLTEQIALKVLPLDSAYNWGSLLLRHLGKDETSSHDVLCSMLRYMSRNPYLALALPKYVDSRRFKLSTMFRGNNSLQQLTTQFKDFVKANPQCVRRAQKQIKLYETPFQLECPTPNELLLGAGNRLLIAPRVPDNSRSDLSAKPVQSGGIKITFEDLQAFATFPLMELIGGSCETTPASRSGNGVSAILPFDVSQHPLSKTHVSKNIWIRLQDDMQYFASQTSSKSHLLGFQSTLESKEEVEFARSKLVALRSALLQIRERDDRFVATGIDQLLRMVNYVDTKEPASTASDAQRAAFRKRLALLFARDHGSEPTLWFTLLIGTCLSTKGFAEIQRLNPFLTDADINEVKDLVVALMLKINRASLVAKCRVTAAQLAELVDKLDTQMPQADKERIRQETLLRASQLAELLCTERHYMTIHEATKSIQFDPRLLVFEFMQDLVLRKAQVDLVEEFKYALEHDESRCHQMLMGGGKTTVIAPILTLLLGAKDQLVIQVVPSALFDFSVKIMRACFSAVLQKHIYTFDFNRWTQPSLALLQKLLKAKSSRGVVVTTPTAVKSFTLKFVEIANAIVELKTNSPTTATEQKRQSIFSLLGKRFSAMLWSEDQSHKRALDALQHQAELMVRMLSLFRSGCVLLDEVDTILHPLKSELNWPMGDRFPLDFTEKKLRWYVPFHLLQAVFCAVDPKLAVKHDNSRESQQILRKLRKAVLDGTEAKEMQQTPHLVLVNRKYYVREMLPLLARWSLVMLAGFGLSGITDEECYQYLVAPGFTGDKSGLARKLTDVSFKLVNLTHDWLHSFLPHILSKTDRVSYGLLMDEHIKEGQNVPKSRKLLAIPFVGKDVPSAASEFAHPDVVIGLSIAAYRYEGLRIKDFVAVLREMKDRLNAESGTFETRPTTKLYHEWIRCAGGRVRGRGAAVFGTSIEDQELVKRAVYMEGQRSDEELFQDMWPLQYVDLRDEEQIGVLHRLLGKLPHVIEFFLDEMVFPETTPHQGLKLSTCGQALGGELLFRQRLGFSGTPSELLPVELGKCKYERGSDAKMITLLTSERVVTYERLPSDWSVEQVLRSVAQGPYHCLLDTGALITGMSNLGVARALLDLGLEEFDGVVFLDDEGRKMILLRQGMRVVDLAQSGVPVHRRFSFYDQIHTTGMDIHQAIAAKAVLTLGANMVFRDYAQGAFRLRGIGKGQTIHLYLIPEVLNCAADVLSAAPELASECEALRELSAQNLVVTEPNPIVLRAVCAWQILNTMKSEQLQFNLLCEQSTQNVWRKRAFWTLLKTFADGQTRVDLTDAFAAMNEDTAGDLPLPLNASVEVFRERVDYTLENAVPERVTLAAKLGAMIRQHEKFLVGPNDAMRVTNIQRMVLERCDEPGNESLIDAEEVEGAEFQRENVQEIQQEQEEEVQVENEQEAEQELQIELENEAASNIRYEKSDVCIPWEFHQLALGKVKQFYRASEFNVYGANRVKSHTLGFPSYLMMSPNFYNPAHLNTTVHRRLKNVNIILEWIPNTANLGESKEDTELEEAAAQAAAIAAAAAASNKKGGGADAAKAALASISKASAGGVLTPSQERILKHAFDLHLTQTLNRDQIREVLGMLGTDVETEEEMDEILEGGLVADFDLLKRIVLSRPLEKIQSGRFYVCVSLAEAETLRGILHSRSDVFDTGSVHRDFVENSNCAVALRIADFHLRTQENNIACRTLSPLEHSHKFIPAKRFQDAQAAQCLRFIDSELFYQEKEVNLLIQTLRLNPCDARRLWFREVRSLRRRNQLLQLDSTPVARAFTEPDQYQFLALRATIARVRGFILAKRMFLMDAFRAFDADRDGKLNCSELFAGFEWLGMRFTPVQIQDFMREVSPTTGVLTFEDFKRVFADKSLREADPLLGGGGSGIADQDLEEEDFVEITILQTRIEELHEIGQHAPGAVEDKRAHESQVVKVLQNCTFKVIPHESNTSVWNSRALKGATFQCSVWRPDLDLSWYSRRKRELFNGGYFGSSTYAAPSSGGKVIELSGGRSQSAIRERLLPHPIRFTLVFSKTAGTSHPLYCWQPVPPSDDFAFLGHVVTGTSREPALNSVYCVPVDWLDKNKELTPQLLWSDVGTSGRPGSLWKVGPLDTIFATVGHEMPKGPFYDFKATSWLISSDAWKMIPNNKE